MALKNITKEFPSNTAFIAAALVAAKDKENAVVVQPRCPRCSRIQANWTVVASFTCPECKTQFIIGSGFTIKQKV